MRVCVVSVFLVMAGPFLALAAAPPQAGDLHLVIVPPWTSAATVVGHAGGQVIGLEAAPLGILAQGAAPDFAARAYAAGAVWVGDGTRLAALCGAAA